MTPPEMPFSDECLWERIFGVGLPAIGARLTDGKFFFVFRRFQTIVSSMKCSFLSTLEYPQYKTPSRNAIIAP